MPQKPPKSLLGRDKLPVTIYAMLIIANLLFGLLHPEYVVVAGSGITFFAVLVLLHF